MNPGEPKAVFLSYASQDAEAAKRICEALRAAGVEVWFDTDGGLEHGDEWDAKIRRQIRECALFLPIISANTQARHEGYFRIEWELAAQRAMGIASGVPFILPVVIDDTREPDALVPDRFRAVQWTRLPGGVMSPDVRARYLKLWSQRIGGRTIVSHPDGAMPPTAAPPWKSENGVERASWRWRGWSVAAVAAIAAAASGWWWLRSPAPAPFDGGPVDSTLASPAGDGRAPATRPPAGDQAGRLVGQVQDLLLKPGGGRSKLDTAAGLAERALEIDPTLAEGWAVASLVDSQLVHTRYDRSAARIESARTKAARALNLAPGGFEPRLAHATYLALLAGPAFAAEAELRLKTLRAEQPANPKLLLVLSTLLRSLGRFGEAEEILGEIAERGGPAAASALNSRAYARARRREFAAAESDADRSIALYPFTGNVGLKVQLALRWHGDLDRAKSALALLPASELTEDFGLSAAVRVHLWRREPDALLALLAGAAREWLTAPVQLPTALLTGDAHATRQRLDAARDDWRRALAAVEQRLAATPSDRDLLEWKAYLEASLGNPAGARSTWQRAGALPGTAGSLLRFDPMHRVLAPDAILDELEERARIVREDTTAAAAGAGDFITAADLRLNPDWDGIRALPRFQALLARLEADPRFTPQPAPAPAAAAPVAEKSVAVLPFENLSADPENGYFSDGIAEELLTLLQKIPDLRVAARTSAFSFKGRNTPIREIARQLGVTHVVEGSVRKAGNEVRISAKLVKADDGFSVWSSGSLRRELKDIFAVQEEIARLIADNLEVTLAGAAAQRRGTVNPENYDRLLAARSLAQRETNAGWTAAVAVYRQLLARDPQYADAWAEMARAYVQLGRFGGMPIADAMREARRAAQRALELNPDQVAALVALGWVQRTADWDWNGARRSFRRALELAPTSASVMGDAAVLFYNLGLVEEGIALARRAVILDPLNARAQVGLGFILSNAGRWEECLVPLRESVALSPAIEEARSHIARALLRVDRVDEAEAVIRDEPNEAYRWNAQALILYQRGRTAEAETLLSDFKVKYGEQMADYVASNYAIRGRTEEALHWCELALAQRGAGIAWMKTNLHLRTLHADPRFEALLRRMGLADDQLQ